jgi:hypothetical protein
MGGELSKLLAKQFLPPVAREKNERNTLHDWSVFIPCAAIAHK